MDALVMCGGEGTRLDADREKPLYHVGGQPMIDSVLDALAGSRVEEVTAVVSPATPLTRSHVDYEYPGVATLEAPGDGYVADLQYAIEGVDRPILTIAADLPLLTAAVVDDILDAFGSEPPDTSATVCVPASLKRALGASVDTTRPGDERELAPTGVNVVAGDDERTIVSWDARLAVNVNRPADATIAEALE